MGVNFNSQPISSINPKGVENIPSNVEKKPSDASSKTNFTNVALKTGVGALALMGTLGAADVLLCKGKHIDKLTGQGKKFEEAIARATESETKASSAELRAVAAEERAVTSETSVSELKTKLANLGKSIEEKRANAQSGVGFYKNCPDITKFLQALYSDSKDFPQKEREFIQRRVIDVLDAHNCGIEADVSKFATDPDYKGMFEVNKQTRSTKPKIASPAITDKITGKVILPGMVFCA